MRKIELEIGKPKNKNNYSLKTEKIQPLAVKK